MLGLPCVRADEVGDEPFLLAVESPGDGEVSLGVLFKCSDCRAVRPRVRYIDVEPVGGRR